MQPLDILTPALRSINAVAPGDPTDSLVYNDAFTMLNDMLDQWSNSPQMLFAKQEVIHEITAGTYIYTIGPGGNVGASITGSISGQVLTVTAISSGALSVGMGLSGSGIAANTIITSYNTGRGGNGTSAIGTYNLNLSNTFASGPITTFAARPLRINSAIVRVVNSLTGTLDYPVAVINLEEYELIGIKTLSGPWPRAVYYQPSMPMGVLNYWPNPGQGEMHLFCDMLFAGFSTLNDNVQLPQGYKLAIVYNLAELLIPEYGRCSAEHTSHIARLAMNGRNMIKRTNAQPQQAARFDDVLTTKRRHDAGWILHGGFN